MLSVTWSTAFALLSRIERSNDDRNQDAGPEGRRAHRYVNDKSYRACMHSTHSVGLSNNRALDRYLEARPPPQGP